MFDLTPIDPAELGLSAERLGRIGDFFQTYLDEKKLPNITSLVSRHGEIAYFDHRGVMDWDSGRPVAADTIYRFYSMTKPVTAVAAMMMFEEGKLRLEHELSRYIPEFANVKVWDGGTAEAPALKDPDREITILDLFTHTSGVTYAFLFQHPVDQIYRNAAVGLPFETLEQQAQRIATLPLVFSPGAGWNYGHSTDLLARVVEIVSGQTLDAFFKQRIFEPLGMMDTDFWVPEDKLDRLAACYQRNPQTGEITMADGAGAATLGLKQRPMLLNGGGGLVSTVPDYLKFCLMIAHGGELNGHRFLSPKTIEFMTRNHLPGGQTLKEMGDKTFSEARLEGNGFGLGWSVLQDSIAAMAPGSEGTFSWGGLANTFFWIDPEEELICIQATQMIPTGAYPIRPQFQQLVYAALET